ncbi:MAG: MMPL family transporter [Spirochaetales bacterium]|nr:MMPL family transporter [Spirochaetales bacterium]
MKTSRVEKLLLFSTRHFKSIFLAVLVVTLVLGIFAFKLKINADVESLIAEGDIPEGFSEKAFLNSDYLILAFYGKNLYDVRLMSRLAPYLDTLASLEHIGTPITPFNQYTFEKRGAQLRIVRFSPTGEIPKTAEEMKVFQERILTDRTVRGLLVSEDGRVLCFLYPYKPMEDYAAFMDTLDPLIDEMRKITRVYVSGPLPFEKAVRDRLLGDFSRLILLSLAVILIILYTGFKSFRITIMPLGIVITGTIWTLGLMSLLRIPLSVISIMTPPLVLTLGTSYTIHILNQYFRDLDHTVDSNQPITGSVFSVGRTIVMAAATTIIGFFSLLVTQLEQTRDFGLATSLGIFSCAVLSIFLLPGLLSRIRKPSKKQQNLVTSGPLVQFLDALGSFAARNKRWVLLSLAAFPLLFVFSLRHINYDSNYLGYFPKKERVVRDFYFIAEHLSGINQVQVTLQGPSEEEGYFLKPEVLRDVSAFEDTLRDEAVVSYLISFPSYIREINRLATGEDEIPTTRGLILLLSRYFTTLAKSDGSQNMLSVMANEDFTQLVCTFRTFDKEHHRFESEKEMQQIIQRAGHNAERLLPSEIRVSFSGGSLRYTELYEQTREDQLKSTILALVFIFIITSFFFRSPLYGLLSLLPMVSGITALYIFMALTAIPLDMTTLMVSSVAIGIGVDDSIHFLLQYRKQRKQISSEDPVRRTLHITGRPIVLTSVSIMGGILILVLSGFKPIVYFGVLVSFTLLATTLGCILILPVILNLLHPPETGNLDHRKKNH